MFPWRCLRCTKRHKKSDLKEDVMWRQTVQSEAVSQGCCMISLGLGKGYCDCCITVMLMKSVFITRFHKSPSAYVHLSNNYTLISAKWLGRQSSGGWGGGVWQVILPLGLTHNTIAHTYMFSFIEVTSKSLLIASWHKWIWMNKHGNKLERQNTCQQAIIWPT